MTRHRFLGAANSSAATATTTAPPPPPDPVAVDSDFVVILAALLCALICVLGLIAVARCAWLRRLSSFSSGGAPPPSSPPPPASSKANKGLKKKVLRSLPKLTVTPDAADRYSDCTICLAEFVDGDEIRVLPHCGHAFHVFCIDPWLGSHSSCPSCRRILVAAAAACDKCGSLPAATPSSSSASASGTAEAESRMKQREDQDSRFLP